MRNHRLEKEEKRPLFPYAVPWKGPQAFRKNLVSFLKRLADSEGSLDPEDLSKLANVFVSIELVR